MASKPIIFLDFDGVLNNIGSMLAFGTCDKFDPVSVGLMEKLAVECDASVVISSSWRIGAKISYLCEVIYENGGEKLAERIIDKTPVLNTGRGTEIKKWLDDSGHGGAYVIIDDDSDMLEGQPFVHTNGRDGFRLPEYHQALLMLNPDHKDIDGLRAYMHNKVAA